jgi:FkbM family methyltransferase
MARKFFPKATFHSFEIVPATFQMLLEITKSDPRIIPQNVGLSDQIGKISISYSSLDSTTATGQKIDEMRYHEDWYDQSIECEVTTGREYLSQSKLGPVYLLKIDVEGMDFKVLKGFGDALNGVKAIQFEYGVFNISSSDLLVDFCALLNSHDFIVGQIYPKFVDFFDYHFSREDFKGHNYIAVKRDDHSLIAKLKGKHA